MGRPPPRLRSLPIVLVAFAVLLASGVARQPEQRERPSYSEFLGQVDQGQVREVTLNTKGLSRFPSGIGPKNNKIDVQPRRGEKYETAYPDNTEQSLVNTLRAVEQAQPYVAVAIEPLIGVDPKFQELVVKNFGATAAFNVRLESEPPMERAAVGGRALTLPTLPTLVPGQDWRVLWDFWLSSRFGGESRGLNGRKAPAPVSVRSCCRSSRKVRAT